MWSGEELGGTLAHEITSMMAPYVLSMKAVALVALIALRLEQIESFHSCRTLLSVSKYEVDP